MAKEAAEGRAPRAPRSGREDNSGEKRRQQRAKKEEGQEQEKEGGGNTGIPAPPPRRPAGENNEVVGGLRVLEGLAATGLRALRYALEIDAVDSVHAVDLDPSAVAAMRRNVALNAEGERGAGGGECGGVSGGGGAEAKNPTSSNSPPRAHRVHPSQGDARLVMLANANCYDVVDLDPYGSPAVLLDAAVRAVAHGGENFFPSSFFFFEEKKSETLTKLDNEHLNPFFFLTPKTHQTGLLCVTATDMAVLCGANPGSCYSKYASMPLHKPYGHEQGLRILLAAIETAAARAGRVIEPLLSASVDFYARVFVRVRAAPGAAKSLPLRLAHVYQSIGCDSFHLQRVGRDASRPNRHGVRDPNNAKVVAAPAPAVPGVECPHTGARWAMGGPLWAGPLHDLGWVRAVAAEVATVSREAARREKEKEAAGGGGAAAAAETASSSSSPVVPIYQAAPRVLALLTAVAEELPDAPLYYSMHSLSRTLRCTPPPAETLRSAVLNAGFRVSGSHACPLALKTDAPPHVIWDIMRCWVAEHCGSKGGGGKAAKQQAKAKGGEGGGGEEGAAAAAALQSAAERILSVEPELKASFARAQGAGKPNGSGLMLPSEAAAPAAASGPSPSSAHQQQQQRKKVARFLPNPEPHWGPKARAGKGRKAVAQAERNEALAAAKESVAAEARERARGAEEAVTKRAERAAKAAAEAAGSKKELSLA